MYQICDHGKQDGEPCEACAEIVKQQMESAASSLLNRYGVTSEETSTTIKPLVLWMYDHGIPDLRIHRDGAKALITINGVAI